MSGFESPNYTQIPNDLFDMVPSMGFAELKVTLVICRETFGYHRETKRMSIRKLARAAGLTARNAYLGAEEGVKRGTLTKGNDGGVTIWGVVVSVSPTDTLYPLQTHTVSPTDTPSIKQRVKKKREIKSQPNPSTKRITDAFTAACGYPVQWSAGNGKAAKWLADNGYTPEQVVACYKHLKSQTFWADKVLGLPSLAKQIGEFVKAHPTPAADGIDYNKWGYTAKGELVKIK